MNHNKGVVPILIVLIIIGVLAVGGGTYYFLVKKTPKSVACTQEAKICPDGSAVGRTGPKCEFAPCPTAKPEENAATSNSPEFDNVYFVVSSNGKNWQPGNFVAKEASVPDIIQLEKDSGNFKRSDLLIYFVDFSNFNFPVMENLGLVVSQDNGKTWDNKTIVNLANKPNKGAAVDPSVVQLDDGRLRLYFFGSETTEGDPALVSGPHKVYSAISSDGINFTAETGARFQDNNLTDPEVIRYGNQWFMYYSVGTATKLAVSGDGLNFSAQTITDGDIGGVPGAVVFDGSIRLFACGKGITTATASDGINFTKEQDDIFDGKIQGIVCDPSVIKMDNGEYSMVYKTRIIPQ